MIRGEILASAFRTAVILERQGGQITACVSCLIGPSFQENTHTFSTLMACIFTWNHERRLFLRKESR